MKQRSMFVAVRLSSEACDALTLGRDYYARPMPWSLWFKAIFPHKNNPWRFVRVYDLDDIEQYPTAIIEDGDLVLDGGKRFGLERPNALLIVQWGIEAVYYGTLFRVWRWPVFKALKKFFSEF